MKTKTHTLLPSESSEGNHGPKPKFTPPEPTGKKEVAREKLRQRKKAFRERRKAEMRALDLTGDPRLSWDQRIGERVYDYVLLRRHDTLRMWCQCVCGKEQAVRINSLKCGDAKSCGCQRKRHIQEASSRRHPNPRSQEQEYRIYHQMKQRCHNSNDSSYPFYGARGIRVCPRWLESYYNFLADMGRRPSLQHSIDRIDYDGNYCPENCRWATRTEQANNTRNTLYLTLNGVSKTSTSWVQELREKIGLSKQNIADRKRWGWSDERILTTPVKHPKQSR